MDAKEMNRERVRRFRELKKNKGLAVVCNDPVMGGNDFEERLIALEEKVRRLENPDEVARKHALKPGSRPNELYGA
jgi:hypothetical protein